MINLIRKKKKNVRPKIEDILKLVRKPGDIKIKSEFAICSSSFSPSLEDLRCNIGALRVGSDHAKWIRRGVLCLSFSLSPRAQFMIGQHIPTMDLRYIGTFPPPVYKNRPAEISSRDGTLLFNSLGPAILGNPRKTNKLLNTPGRILGDKGHGCVTRRRLKGSRPPIRRTKRISFALFNVPRHSYARYYYERTVHLVEEKKGKKGKTKEKLGEERKIAEKLNISLFFLFFRIIRNLPFREYFDSVPYEIFNYKKFIARGKEIRRNRLYVPSSCREEKK